MIDRSLFSLPGIRKAFAVLIGIAFVSALLLIAQAFSLSIAVTNLWNAQAVFDQSIWLASFLLCFVVIHALLCGQDAYMDRYAFERADKLRQDVLQSIFVSGPDLVQTSGTGNTTTLVLEGVEQVENYLRLILPKMCRVVVIPLVLLIPIFFIDWISGIILLIVFPFIILYMIILGSAAQKRAAKQHKKFQIMSNHFIDSLRGIETLKAFGTSKLHGQNIYKVSEEFRTATMGTLRVATLSSLVLDMFATLSVAAVAIMLGLRLLDGTLDLFPALFTLVLAPEYFKPIREFASDYHASLDGKNALVSIRLLIEKCDQKANQAKTAVSTWSQHTSLKVQNLSYAYPEAQILHDLSFEAQGLSKIGIIGASGAGKSTLMKILAGFALPDQGSFELDGIKFKNLHEPQWQKQLSYLPQDPYIFHASLRDNIAFYHPNAQEDEIKSAISIVGLEDLVAELPQGIETLIGESERALSGGQAQRIALARLCLDKQRKILLFDEPTAHLDIETEMELKQKMLPLMEGRLVFFATHRLHWMNDMDTILVLDEGRLVEAGSVAELNARGGTFSRLVSQMRGAAHGED